MERSIVFELTKEFKKLFQQALDEKNDNLIISYLENVSPADISLLLKDLSIEYCSHVFQLVGNETTAKILENTEKDYVNRFIECFSLSELAFCVEQMDTDDGADILYKIPVEDRNEVFRLIKNDEKASHLMELLRYEEDVAGGIMAKELVKANYNWSIQQCIEEIRKQAENVKIIYSVYVVDDYGKLLGKVAIKKILLTNDTAKVKDIYDDKLIYVETSTSEEEVISVMRKYDLDAIPVVNARGKLVGRITMDDIVDIMRENADEVQQLMSGVSSDVEEHDSIWKISKSRLPWLMIGMTGGIFAAHFMGFFKEEITIVPALAFFIPLITASGGNVGIQSSSLVVQSLANPSAFKGSPIDKLFKGMIVAALNGVILSLIVFICVSFLMNDYLLAITVSIALFSVVLLASFMGTITPLILNKMNINPALASGPFITTTNDILGLIVYFAIAHLLCSV